MKGILKILILLLKNSTIFSIKGLREVRNKVYRKFYKASKMYVADRVTISTAHYNKKAYFKCNGQVNIGTDVYIDYSGGVEIFDKVAISEGAKIFTHNHSIHDGAKDWMINPIKFSSLSIGDYTWIGANSIVLPSVTKIAEGTVLAAGAVLTKDTEPYGVYAGNPAVKITHRRINETA
ncbi:acyltransferase [Tenacibaculum sp. SDUM215027]|uniref:acyltransferase n=1 Tax=Tenacibaculum sp. SDUM215027 TaxID=3422596 RepID=UPI003D3180C3